MALTRDFKTTIVERIERDPVFASALIDEAATLVLNGEAGTGRLILGDLVNPTAGSEQFDQRAERPSKGVRPFRSSNIERLE